MKIKSTQLTGLILLAINGLYGMERVAPNKQKEILERLADSQKVIDEHDILEASKCLGACLVKESLNETLQNILNTVLFKLSQAATGNDAAELAKILVKAGANPCQQFSVNEVLTIGGKSAYSQTEYSYKTDAKSEAKGLLKRYLDSL